MRILELRSENFKRLSVVEITPQGHIVDVTGANGQGKTSVLDSIWAALGGKNAVPDEPIRKGHDKARIQLKIGNEPGAPVYIVERRFTPTDSYIKVTDSEGSKHAKPDTILKSLMGEIGFDPLAFTRMEPKKQYDVLRDLVGLDLDSLDRKRTTLFEERTQLGRDIKNAEGAATSIVVPADLPDEPPAARALLDKLVSVDSHNAKIADVRAALERTKDAVKRQREAVVLAESLAKEAQDRVRIETEQFESLQREQDRRMTALAEMPEWIDAHDIRRELEIANRTLHGFELQRQRIDADARVTGLKRKHDAATSAINEIDAAKLKALAEARMPIDGLAFVEDALTFNGLPLSAASSAEQLRISAAIGAALNPKLRVLLVRDGSLLDSKSLDALAQFAKQQDMQIWVERVEESGEIGIVLVDGHVKGQEALVEAFERGENDGKVADPKAPQVVDEARMKRVNDYIEGKLAALPNDVRNRNLAALDQANAEVKVKLANFPEVIQTRWNPAYLEAVRAVRQ